MELFNYIPVGGQLFGKNARTRISPSGWRRTPPVGGESPFARGFGGQVCGLGRELKSSPLERGAQRAGCVTKRPPPPAGTPPAEENLVRGENFINDALQRAGNYCEVKKHPAGGQGVLRLNQHIKSIYHK